MRFFQILFIPLVVLCLMAAPARAQDSAPPAEPVPEEYKNVPEGLLLPEERPLSQKKEIENPDNETEDSGAMTTDDILAAYNDGKFDVAAKYVVPLANSGYHKAEELLGIMCRNGQGVPKDPKQAVFWLIKAADENLPLAQHYLATMYYLGEGLPEDPVKALMWLHIAIRHYPEGADKNRAIEDRNNLYLQISRRDKDRAVALAKEWLAKKDEELLDIPK